LELLVIILIPIVCTILIVAVGQKSTFLRNTLVMVPSVVDFVLVCHLAWLVTHGGSYSLNLVDLPFFALKFKADPFSTYMALSMTFLWMMTNIYSFGYMAHEHAQTRYYACLTLNITAAMGIVFATNLVTFFIFFELLTIAVYPLVVHEETEEAYTAGVVYGVYLLTGGAAVLLGTIILYNLTGTFDFVAGGIPALAEQSKLMLTVLFILFTLGFGFKAGLVPLYYWLPEAMIAPTPISAVLHAVAVVNVGVFGFIRVIYNIFGPKLYHQMGFGDVIAVLGAVTILYAAVMGLRQKEIKRMLAMSTINQLSFMLLGVVSFSMIGMLGGILHIYFHAFMKITLFYCAGAIITQSGNKYVAKMGGLAKHMPITMTCFAIAALGIIGLPPVAGWVSKWYLMQGFLSVGKPIYAVVFLLSSIIELGFFGPPIFSAFFREEEPGAFSFERDTSRFGNEAPWTMWLPIVIVAFFSLLFGVWGFVPHRMAQPALTGLLGRGFQGF
jgi:formate hydrogenlyase subunit 3/multisubunit Na+/H+ antiporter MnhD subunit